jgi:hypothetical protein
MGAERGRIPLKHAKTSDNFNEKVRFKVDEEPDALPIKSLKIWPLINF